MNKPKETPEEEFKEPRKFKLTKMSGRGDELVAEWTDKTSPEELAKIEAEFKSLMAKGFFAADLSTNELVKEFNSGTDMLMIPKMAGG